MFFHIFIVFIYINPSLPKRKYRYDATIIISSRQDHRFFSYKNYLEWILFHRQFNVPPVPKAPKQVSLTSIPSQMVIISYSTKFDHFVIDIHHVDF